jgi:hypothetical protein
MKTISRRRRVVGSIFALLLLLAVLLLLLVQCGGSTAAASPLNGTWKGTYFCIPQGKTGMVLVIHAADGKMTGTATTTIINGYSKARPGGVSFTGTYSASGETFVWGEEQNPQWSIVGAVWHGNPLTGSKTVLSGPGPGLSGCDSFSVTKQQ